MPAGPQQPSSGGGIQPTKAIISIKKSTGATENVTCYLNPTEYTIGRSVSWHKDETNAHDVPSWTFGGGGSNTMSLELWFDTSLETSGEKDVRKRYTNKVVAASYKEAADKPPPNVIFSWGTTWSFEAVITSVSQRFTLFLPDGTPIRSIMSVSLTQVIDNRTFARQNPTSGGTPGKIHIVRDGDRLDLLAAEHYKKPMLWRYIAEHNDIDNPRNLIPGQRLIIPPLP